jgi:hypothetical protein
MANDLSGDRLVLDTANATDILIPGRLQICGMEWVNPANATDEMELVDGANKLIYGTVAGSNNGGTIGPDYCPGWVDGIRLTKLTSGKLVIYLG